MGSQAPTHSSYWEKLPTEVRDLIFDRLSDGYPNKNDYFGVCCICDNYTVIPPLLIALRGLPHSYRDALKRFNAINQVLDTCFDPHVNEICRLTETELKAFKEMRMRLYVLPMAVYIRKADIRVDYSQISRTIVPVGPLMQSYT
jgi:hypothetical protein